MTSRSTSPEVVVVDTPSLGDRSYLAHDGRVGIVVDPQRDIDRVLAAAGAAGVRITHVLETHLHNDYVTGGLALARATGAAYLVNGEDEVAFDRTPVHDGDVVVVSATMRVRVLATPGHTFTHLSYVLETGQDEVVGVFTGGSLLFGSTGRPDLLGAEHTHELVQHQHTSVRRLADLLPVEAAVLPTHGFGSFCSSGSGAGVLASTIGRERAVNAALNQDAQVWAHDVLAALEDHPAYYVHMALANAAGPDAPDLTPPAFADPETIATRIEAGEWVVDLRSRTAFAAGHVVGSLNIGLDGQFATYLGWLIPWGTPLSLLGDTAEQVAAAQRELVRIGIDDVAGAATGTPRDWTDAEPGSFERATFADLAQARHHRRVVVLDVRRASEHQERHLHGALNIPVHQLLSRLDEVPTGEIWVHCAGGYRASIAASVLAAHGAHVVAVDDDFTRAGDSDLDLVSHR